MPRPKIVPLNYYIKVELDSMVTQFLEERGNPRIIWHDDGVSQIVTESNELVQQRRNRGTRGIDIKQEVTELFYKHNYTRKLEQSDNGNYYWAYVRLEDGNQDV